MIGTGLFLKSTDNGFIGYYSQPNGNFPVTACSACLYAKATRRYWITKKMNNKENSSTAQPGLQILVDQLVSPTPKFRSQTKQILTAKKCKYMKVPMDHYSKFAYTYFQKTTTEDETMEGKTSF